MRTTMKKYGRRKAGTWGRVHGPRRGNSKRAANKAVRRMVGELAAGAARG